MSILTRSSSPPASCYTLLPGAGHCPGLVQHGIFCTWWHSHTSTREYPHPLSCISLWGLSSSMEDIHFVLQLPKTYFICTKLVIARVEWPASFADLPCPLLMDFQSRGFVMAVHVITACMLGADAHIHTDLGWAQGFVNSTTVSLTQFPCLHDLPRTFWLHGTPIFGPLARKLVL